MSRKSIALGTAAAILIAAAGYGLYFFGQRHAVSTDTHRASSNDPTHWTPAQSEAATRRHIESGIKAGDVDPVTGRRVLYYQDPMVPGKKFDAPGKSPFMDMMLVPVYAGAQNADTSGVTVSTRIQQNLGVRTAEVTEGTLSPQLTAVGNIAWNA